MFELKCKDIYSSNIISWCIFYRIIFHFVNNAYSWQLRLFVIYPIRVGVLDVVSNSECHEQWRGAAEPLFMALGSWKPSQKHQRGLDMASHTSVHIHSNEAWNYDD